MIGVESRCQLLVKLGDSLVKLPEIFGADGRPGNLVGKCGVFSLNTAIRQD